MAGMMSMGNKGEGSPGESVIYKDLAKYDKIFADVAYWKKLGEEYQNPLIVTGTVLFTPNQTSGFVMQNREKKNETSSTTGSYLDKRIAELQATNRSKEEELINYAKNHQILSLDANQNTVVDRLAGLNKQLLEAENERKAAEAAYRAANPERNRIRFVPLFTYGQ